MTYHRCLASIASRVGRLAALLLVACSSPDSSDTAGNGGHAGEGASGGSSGSGDGGVGAQAGIGGGGTGGTAASDELCGERPGGSVYATHRLRFENSDGSITVQLERTYEMVGSGESAIYRLDAFALRMGTSTSCVTDSASLEYENTHHNWMDAARAEIDGTNYDLRMLFDTGVSLRWSNTLSGLDGDGNVVLADTALILTGSPVSCYECPGTVPLFISEVQLDNVSTLADEAGEYDPWIEIFNPWATAVDLTGWTLSDDFAERDKWTFPAISIPRHEALVVFADGDVDQGDLHASFRLAHDGSEIVLTTPDGVTDGGAVHGAQGPDQSSAFDWNTAQYALTNDPTPGAGPPE